MATDQHTRFTIDAMVMATHEILATHAALDEMEVPRKVGGQLMSMSQRVLILVGAYRSACTRVAKGE